MNYYHVAYFMEDKDAPTLSGLTIKAKSISDAEKKFNAEMNFQVRAEQILYIIKIN